MTRVVRDEQLPMIRVTGQLRAALEDEAAADSRGLSSLIRKILVNAMAQRITERQEKAA